MGGRNRTAVSPPVSDEYIFPISQTADNRNQQVRRAIFGEIGGRTGANSPDGIFVFMIGAQHQHLVLCTIVHYPLEHLHPVHAGHIHIQQCHVPPTAAHFSSASRPSVASPTTVMSAVSPRMRFRPSRKSLWSSARKVLMIMIYSVAIGEGELSLPFGSRANGCWENRDR